MLTKDQSHRESDHRWTIAQRAAYWRARAEAVRRKAVRATAEREVIAFMKIARDYEFLAEFEEKPRRWL